MSKGEQGRRGRGRGARDRRKIGVQGKGVMWDRGENHRQTNMQKQTDRSVSRINKNNICFLFTTSMSFS